MCFFSMKLLNKRFFRRKEHVYNNKLIHNNNEDNSLGIDFSLSILEPEKVSFCNCYHVFPVQRLVVIRL